jgi:hypothetical protein
MKDAAGAGDRAQYATPMDSRWIGEDGYKGLKRLPLVTADRPGRHA